MDSASRTAGQNWLLGPAPRTPRGSASCLNVPRHSPPRGLFRAVNRCERRGTPWRDVSIWCVRGTGGSNDHDRRTSNSEWHRGDLAVREVCLVVGSLLLYSVVLGRGPRQGSERHVGVSALISRRFVYNASVLRCPGLGIARHRLDLLRPTLAPSRRPLHDGHDRVTSNFTPYVNSEES